MKPKHWLILVGVLVVLGLIFGAGYHYRKQQAWEETVKSLTLKIEAKDAVIEKAREDAKLILKEADIPSEQADEVEAKLETNRAAIKRAKRAKAAVETRLVLAENQNALLEEALALRKKEIEIKDEAIDLLTLALDESEDRNVFQEKKYVALTKSKKSEKRKRIGTLILSHSAVFATAWVGGRYSR